MSDRSSDGSVAAEHEDHPPLPDERIRSPAADFVAGVLIFLVSLYTLVDSYNMPSFGDPSEKAYNTPGLTPMVVSAVLLVLSAALMIRSRNFSLSLGFARPQIETIRVLITFTVIFVFVAVMPWIGYVPATFLMLFAFQMIFARKRTVFFVLVWAIGLSAALTGVLYYVFLHVFMIPMP